MGHHCFTPATINSCFIPVFVSVCTVCSTRVSKLSLGIFYGANIRVDGCPILVL